MAFTTADLPTHHDRVSAPREGGAAGLLPLLGRRLHIPLHSQDYPNRFISEITFPSRSGRDGILLADALSEEFDNLIGGDDPAFVGYTGPAISLRFEVNSV